MVPVTLATPLLALDIVVIDTETTGLDARKARIVQIGALNVRLGCLQDEPILDVLVDPGEPIPTSTIAVHGITDAAVAGASRFSEVAPKLEAFVGQSVLVGHTIGYDLDVLTREYALAGRPRPKWRALDVRTLARIVAPSLADHGLDGLCEWTGVKNSKRHDALADARATAEVLVALIPMLRARQIRTLGEAEQASLALAEADARAAGGLMSLPDVGAAETRAVARIDSFPYRHRVREIMSAPPVVAEGTDVLAIVLATLLERRVSSVLVRLADGTTGIATERDVLRAIHQHGAAALEAPVERIASRPLQVVDQDAFVYRAIGRIQRLGVRHLGVRGPDGAITGVVTTRNLLRNRSTTALALGDEIEAARDEAGLAVAWAKVPDMVRGLLAEAVDPRTICAVVSSEIRNMTRRAAQLAEDMLEAKGGGRPPVPYAVLVLGSGGRGESQLAADQDNAVVFAGDEADGAAADYFARHAEIMNGLLDAAGIAYCKGGVMASNAAWRMSAADWLKRIDGWVGRHRPEDLLNVDIFFDAAVVHGDRSLAAQIWDHAWDRAHRARDFIKFLTEAARVRGQPLTLLGNLRVDGKGRFDVKKYGLMPIFTSARVLSIKHDVRQRSTEDRLNGVAALGIDSPESAQRILDGQSELLGFVLEQQLADLDAGVPPSPTVVAGRLDKSRRARLKTALGAADEAVGLASEGLI